MSDERYERSADMRLLELRREALGVPPRVIGSTSYTDPEMFSESAKDDDDAYVQSGTILMTSTDARPRIGLIPGAVVTVTLSVVNEGDAAAREVFVSLPLPVDTAYRPGTLAIDATTVPDEIANELFANGATIGDIEPGARRSVALKLLIEAGTTDITVLPHLRVLSGAVLGLRAIRLTRKSSAEVFRSIERPFYESDEEEHAREPLAPRPADPRFAIVQPREVPPVSRPPIPTITPAATAPPVQSKSARTAAKRVAPKATPSVVEPANVEPIVGAPLRAKSVKDEPLKAKPAKDEPLKIKPAKIAAVKTQPKPEQPKTRTKTKPKSNVAQPDVVAATALTERPKIEVVRSADEQVSFAGQGGPILAVRIDRKRLTMLSGLFSGPSLGMIAHYLVLNALATRDPLPGDGEDRSIATFVASQEQLLSRALITTRLGKLPSPDSVGAVLPLFPPALATHEERRTIESPPPGQALLFRAFQPREVTFVRRMLSNEQAAPFMRAAQLFVGLCANDVLLANDRDRRNVGVALTAYAALATGEISRIFLRAKLNRTPELFRATDAAFDDAARTVLAALGRCLA